MSQRIAYCTDADLNYAQSRHAFAPGAALTFDHAYRLAHLPLVAPQHPLVIHEIAGQDYRSGRYEKARHALVVMIPPEALASSPVFRAFESELRTAPFAPKVDWELCARRATKLHATVVNGLTVDAAKACVDAVSRTVRKLGPLSLRLGGPFAGDKNLGRLYFPVYPRRLNGDDASVSFRTPPAPGGRASTPSATTISSKNSMRRRPRHWRG